MKNQIGDVLDLSATCEVEMIEDADLLTGDDMSVDENVSFIQELVNRKLCLSVEKAKVEVDDGGDYAVQVLIEQMIFSVKIDSAKTKYEQANELIMQALSLPIVEMDEDNPGYGSLIDLGEDLFSTNFQLGIDIVGDRLIIELCAYLDYDFINCDEMLSEYKSNCQEYFDKYIGNYIKAVTKCQDLNARLNI